MLQFEKTDEFDDRNRRSYRVTRGGVEVGKIVPYRYGNGYQVKIPDNDGDTDQLAPLVHLGLSRSFSHAQDDFARVLELVDAAREAADHMHLLRLMAERKLWMGWPAERLKEFFDLAGRGGK